jgi:hypothetical protein
VLSLDKFAVTEKMLNEKCERFRKKLDDYDGRIEMLQLQLDIERARPKR